jgi:hypothetical protein
VSYACAGSSPAFGTIHIVHLPDSDKAAVFGSGRRGSFSILDSLFFLVIEFNYMIFKGKYKK